MFIEAAIDNLFTSRVFDAKLPVKLPLTRPLEEQEIVKVRLIETLSKVVNESYDQIISNIQNSSADQLNNLLQNIPGTLIDLYVLTAVIRNQELLNDEKIKFVRQILDNSYNSLRIGRGDTPLQVAVELENYDVSELILKARIPDMRDPDIKLMTNIYEANYDNLKTPIETAIAKNNLPLIKLLTQHATKISTQTIIKKFDKTTINLFNQLHEFYRQDILLSDDFAARRDGAKPIDNRRAMSNDACKFISEEYSRANKNKATLTLLLINLLQTVEKNEKVDLYNRFSEFLKKGNIDILEGISLCFKNLNFKSHKEFITQLFMLTNSQDIELKDFAINTIKQRDELVRILRPIAKEYFIYMDNNFFPLIEAQNINSAEEISQLLRTFTPKSHQSAIDNLFKIANKQDSPLRNLAINIVKNPIKILKILAPETYPAFMENFFKLGDSQAKAFKRGFFTQILQNVHELFKLLSPETRFSCVENFFKLEHEEDIKLKEDFLTQMLQNPIGILEVSNPQAHLFVIENLFLLANGPEINLKVLAVNIIKDSMGLLKTLGPKTYPDFITSFFELVNKQSIEVKEALLTPMLQDSIGILKLLSPKDKRIFMENLFILANNQVIKLDKDYFTKILQDPVEILNILSPEVHSSFIENIFKLINNQTIELNQNLITKTLSNPIEILNILNSGAPIPFIENIFKLVNNQTIELNQNFITKILQNPIEILNTLHSDAHLPFLNGLFSLTCNKDSEIKNLAVNSFKKPLQLLKVLSTEMQQVFINSLFTLSVNMEDKILKRILLAKIFQEPIDWLEILAPEAHNTLIVSASNNKQQFQQSRTICG